MPISEFPAVVTTGDVQREVGVAGIGPTDFQDTPRLIFVAGDRRDAFNALRGRRRRAAARVDRQPRRPGRGRHPLGQPGGDGVPFTVAGIVAYSLPTWETEGAS